MTTKQKPYTYGDLARVPRGTVMVCTGECQGDFSAEYGAYFHVLDDHEIYCCGRPVRLVTKRNTYIDIARGQS